jgi:hypothetical protein
MERRRPKSYWLETLVVRHVSNEWAVVKGISIAEGFRNILQSIYDKYNGYWEKDDAVPEVPDSMLGNDIAFNWERSHFETFMRRVEESLGWANKALDDDVTKEKAIELWQRVFGDTFPSSIEDEAKKAASSIASGIATVTSKGAINTSSNGVGIPIPGHRFYGGDGRR